MIKKILFAIMLSSAFLIADDLIVDQNSLNQYDRDNFIVFDAFYDDGSSFCGNIRPPHGSPYNCDRVQFDDDFPIIGSNFTIELWAYSDSSSALHRELIGIGEAPQHDFNRPPRPPTITFNYGRQIRYGYGTDGPNSQSRTFIVENVRTENSWNHIAFTFDGERTKLFVNGENVHISQDLSGDLPTQIPIKYLGKGFYGKIDELRIWNYARSRNEILQNMNVQLNGDEEGLLAYYPMDTDANWRIIDKTDNENHAELSNASISSRFYSKDCGFADGSYDCPFPTINSALDLAKGGNRILIKGGRYSEQISRWHKNHSFETSGPKIIIEGYPGENVILDGTVKLQTNWQLVNVNGHSIYKTSVNIDSISRAVQKPIHSIHGTFINDRYMIPAMEINIKNPTDQTYGNPLNPEPGTVWALGLDGPGSNYGTISVLDTLEEWVYNSDEQSLYLYPNNEFDPNNSEVRVRIRDKVLTLMHSDNFEFKNINFFAGSFSFYNSSFLTIENSKFSYSSDVGLSGNTLNAGTHTKFRNCIFEYINSTSAYSQERTMFPTLENCLFRYNDWFQGTANYPTSDRNYRGTSGGGDLTIGGSTWRYITVENSYTAGIFAGQRSLVEYARFENLYEECDCSGIQRNAVGTNFSTTRYIWKLYTRARNGIRFDSACAGTYADIHNVVSVGGKRGFRLKGDGHDAYHLLAYDNMRQDISLPDYKFCGFPGLGGNGEGNLNSNLKNSIAEGSLECNSPDCGDLNSNLNSSGIWYGRQLDENYPPAAYPHLELADPWAVNRQLSNDSLISQYGENPFNNNFQNYDFRPKKGSVLIDGGVVVPGINDGQDDDSAYPLNHPPLYPGQQRAFVGDAPDIGPYEYGDSVYWIPGFRYSYPSVPIPGDGATDVSMEYGLAFNYPWKTDYTGTAATVTVSGPGINRTETLQYPNNVVFETFLPGETYNWSVTVDHVSGGNWSFTTSDKEYPLNDRSLDTTSVDSMLIPYQIKNLQVSNNNLAFLKFDVPSSINNSYNIHLNLVPEKVKTLEGGIVVYKYNYTGWGEKLDVNNIGLIDKSLLTPIDTIFSLIADSLLSLDLSAFIDSSGERSFALGGLDSTDVVSFYSKEKLINDGYGGYTPLKRVWPSLSFSKDSLSIAYDIPLEKEWNLISVPFKGVKTRPKQIFSTLIRKGLLEYVSSPSGYFKPKDPYSTLTSINSKEGYYIKLNGPLNKIFFRGKRTDDKIISLSTGWNMIAYYPDYELAVDKAFESLIASNTLQYVTGFVQGALVYDPDAPQSSTLNTLKPTKGYWVNVNAAVTDFSFPAQTQGDAVGKIAATHSVKHPEVKPNPSFMFVKGKIMGRYNVGDWVKVLSEDNLVVGAAEIIEGGYLRNSAVYGDDVTTEEIDGLKSAEKVSFVYDGDTLASHVQFNPMSFHDVKLDYNTFLPTTFALYQNHPNPFNPITTIRYDLPEEAHVSITIYDITGREVKRIINQSAPAGRYSVNWNGTNQWGKQIASGMYFYRMETPGFQSVKKLIFLK